METLRDPCAPPVGRNVSIRPILIILGRKAAIGPD